ncbi:LemA family protein [Bradymonadaceae bacterium TMQ3]|uniref:LemA family protein n=1 Tax=Lujinxingia sediminis TaxID=2480984 RepID=A0ABY0CQL5_9DELT|nr:LemA family protein [Lujinxingia sediminis]RDV37932.1 LemA family protein [Bradymonadaceae bacterium TMQ3]RVU42740.1 LemA family protein [Lujinxingia sediminis]TXC75290.1 LemA family protein [Bradymonadales bacterium TMQ1]
MSDDTTPRSEPGGVKTKLVMLVLGPIMIGLSVLVALSSFSQLKTARAIDRMVEQRLGGALEGPARLMGEVVAAGKVFSATGYEGRCVIHRTDTFERRGSGDSKKEWHRTGSTLQKANFSLRDASGELKVVPGDAPQYVLPRVYQEQRGKKRVEEYCLEVGSEALVEGVVKRSGNALQVIFEGGEELPMRVVGGGASVARELATGGSFALLMVSLLLLVLGLWSLFNSIGLVSVGGFMVVLTLGVLLSLLGFGARLTVGELEANAAQVARAKTSAETSIRKMMGSSARGWEPVWEEPWNLSAGPFEGLNRAERARVELMRVNVSSTIDEARRYQRRPPEVFFSIALGYPWFKEVALSEAEEALKPEVERGWRRGLGFGAGLGGGALSAILMMLFSFIGLRELTRLRISRNLPTPPVAGVSYGPTEVKGRVVLHPDYGTIVSPVKNRPCVAWAIDGQTYDSSIDHKGKIKKGFETKTYEAVPFYCVDESGQVLVEVHGAEILSDHVETQKRGKDETHYHRIDEGDTIYVLGTATIDPETHTSLRMGVGEKDVPYILSNWSERRVQRSKFRRATAFVAVGLVALMGMALSALGLVTIFSPLMLVGVAAAVFAWALIMPVIFLYNDLIFMRLRVDRAWANIEVALKKRFDLISKLEEVVRGHMEHERGLLEAVSSARARREKLGKSREGLEAVAEEEEVLSQRVMGLVEAYPELKSQELVDQFSQSLTEVENELGLMRQGYNDAVTFYNTRRESFPQKVVAGPLGFTPRLLWEGREGQAAGHETAA